MKRIIHLALLTLGLAPLSAFAIPEPRVLELAPEFLAQIHELFPESQEIAPALLDFRVDPNLHFFREAELSLTFIDEGAGYRNSFGYFLYEDLNQDGEITEDEIKKKEILFPNASKENAGGDLKTGDTFSLGAFPAGTRLGFFLISDGYDEAKETYYSLDSLNPGGTRHLAMLALPDREHVVLGIEDLPEERSDRDFNDLLFTFTTDPKSALSEIIEDSAIPVASSTPLVRKVGPQTSPSPAGEPAEVSLQENLAAAQLEGSGLGCSLARSRKGNATRFSFSALLLFYVICRLWKRHAADASAAFRLMKKRGCLYHHGKDYKKKLAPPNGWGALKSRKARALRVAAVEPAEGPELRAGASSNLAS